MDKTDYYDKMDTLVNDKQTYEVFKRDPAPSLACNVKSTTNYLRLKRPTLLTLNATIDWGLMYYNHLNFMDYRNYTNLVYLCDP